MSDASLSETLPKGDANGLGPIVRTLIDEPHRFHVVMAIIDCKKVTTDFDTGDVVPTALDPPHRGHRPRRPDGGAAAHAQGPGGAYRADGAAAGPGRRHPVRVRAGRPQDRGEEEGRRQHMTVIESTWRHPSTQQI